MTFDLLINLAADGEFTRYYRAVLNEALKLAGSVAYVHDKAVYIYTTCETMLPSGRDYSILSVKRADLTEVPASILPAIRPENRGGDFPADTPFKPIVPEGTKKD